MRLTELEPRWVDRNGQQIGILLLCPHCIPQKRTWLSCFFVGMEHIAGPDGEYALIAKIAPDIHHNDVIPCKRNTAWQKTGDSFENLSVTPSLDASASGHWHGLITNGEVT